MTTFTIKWGDIRRVYPCPEYLPRILRKHYRSMRVGRKPTLIARMDAKDSVAHLMLRSMQP